MSKDLVKLANHLDSLGFRREANLVDALLKKKASNEMGNQMSENLITLKSLISGIAGMISAARASSRVNPLLEGNSGKELLASLHRVAGKAGVTPDEAMNMLSEELDSFKSNKSGLESEMGTSDEPPIDLEVLAKAYEDYTERSLHVNSVKVTDLYWVQEEDSAESHYNVKAEGFWNESGSEYSTENLSQIWLVDSWNEWSMDIEGTDGKMYYFEVNL